MKCCAQERRGAATGTGLPVMIDVRNTRSTATKLQHRTYGRYHQIPNQLLPSLEESRNSKATFSPTHKQTRRSPLPTNDHYPAAAFTPLITLTHFPKSNSA